MDNLAPIFLVGVIVVALVAACSVERTFGRTELTDIVVDMDVLREIESGGDRWAISPAGARGPYQLCRRAWEDAAASIRRRLAKPDAKFNYDSWVHDETVSRVIAYEYIVRVLPRYLTAERLFAGDTSQPCPDSLDARLAAYNAGALTVRRAYGRDPTNWVSHLPRETREYISRYHRSVKQRVDIRKSTKGMPNVQN